MSSLYKKHLDESTMKIDELESISMGAKDHLTEKLSEIKHNYENDIKNIQLKLVEESNNLKNQIELLTNENIQLKQQQQQQQQQQTLQVTDSTQQSQLTTLIHKNLMPETLKQISGSGTSPNLPINFYNLTQTEIYDHIIKIENEKIIELNRRLELELYLDRILKDVELKAPIIANQKKVYTIILYTIIILYTVIIYTIVYYTIIYYIYLNYILLY